jgi:acetaldehyde dehydrogenase/alcohol dehydrogenase
MVNDLASLGTMIAKVKTAQKAYALFTQEQVDQIFKEAAMAANRARIPLAKMAVEETQMGIVEDKIIKNHFAAEYIYNKYRNEKTCGVLSRDNSWGIAKMAEPIGVIAGIIPTTNPTSTVIFKALLALKTRNAIVFSPHPRAKKATITAAQLILDAAVKAGAPENIIGWIDEPTIELSGELMKHSDINLILATGGPGMVKAAYSSGKPAIGVGPGNTPAIIDDSADYKMAVNSIILSKTFDNGTVCASEQEVVVHQAIYDQVKAEFEKRGAKILTTAEKKKLAAVLLINGALNPAVAGQSAQKIAAMAGIEVEKSVRVLIAEAKEVGVSEPFSYEKLSPILGMYKAKDYEEAVDIAVKLIIHGGLGHTSSLFVAPEAREKIDYFAKLLPTARILINTPSSHGAIGDLYNFKLEPSLTLGCGSWGNNSVSENIGVKHLLNIKTIAERRENMLWFRIPPKVYFKYGCLPYALTEFNNKKKAFIVTDKPLYELGYVKKVTDVLEGMGLQTQVFYDVNPDPKLSDVKKGLALIDSFQPDLLIALGGGSPIDAAKIMWLMYEHPEANFQDLAMRFMDIRKRIYKFPELGIKAQLVAIPTTSGTGSEVTPFAVVTDDETGIKYPIADYALTPNMAIVDPELVMSMPKKLCAAGGIDVLTHAVEAYVSIFATEYTNGLALEAIDLVFKYLPESYSKATQESREKMHYAATIAGMAFSNAFLGICHSMAHKLGSNLHIPHGIANSLMLKQVIQYNSTDIPEKQAAFAQYKYPQSKERYAQIASHVGITGKTDEEKVQKLIAKITELQTACEIPQSIKEWGISESDFNQALDEMTEQAFDDQCTGANPRYPLIADLKEMYKKAYTGKV